jgi:hypothetical protein
MLILTLSACDTNDDNDTPDATVVTGVGDISTQLDAFRAVLGAQLNNAPGQTEGRREVNWDGVPDAFTNVDTFPGDFFGNSDPEGPNGRKRGLILATGGNGFRVSDNDFTDLDATYDGQFDDFSPARTFIPTGSAVQDVTFRVPGETTEAVIHGMGIVFSDVDEEGSTTMEFYNGNESLGRFEAPVNPDGGFSFLGVFFQDVDVTRVRVISGASSLGANVLDVSDGGSVDLVVMDDFLYDEPRVAVDY